LLRVLVGAERHDTVDLALHYLGLGAPQLVPAEDQGRIDVDELARALASTDGPTIVALQAGNGRSTTSPAPSRWRTNTAPGSTSMALSGCGPQHLPVADT
jgi:hypothetical protein